MKDCFKIKWWFQLLLICAVSRRLHGNPKKVIRHSEQEVGREGGEGGGEGGCVCLLAKFLKEVRP